VVQMSSTQANPPFDGGVTPTVSDDHITNLEQALARLAQLAASDTFDARPRGSAADRSAEARAETLDPADLRGPIAREQRSVGDRGTRARVAIAVFLAATAIWAWRWYGGHDPTPEQAATPPAVETSAPPAAQSASIAPSTTPAADEPSAASADHQQIETMARDLVALHRTVEQLAADHQQLTHDIEKLLMTRELDELRMSRELAKRPTAKSQADKLAAEKADKRVLRRVSAPPAPSVAAPARNPAPIAPMPPQATPQVSTLSPLSRSAPQIPTEPQSSDPPPFRPPLPVPQP
jgi:hypothetical protein